MAEHIKVTLEHHFNRRYHAIKHGPGRRPAAVTYGKFNLRYRDPQLSGKRVRVTLDVSGLAAALEARGKKEVELNALPVERKVTRTLQRVADKYLAEIKATRKKKTHQAYSVALNNFTDVVGEHKPVAEITRGDMLDYRVYLREEKKHAPRSEWNKFSNVMGFLKMQGVRSGVTKHDWPKYVEEEPEIYERQQLDALFSACDEHERLVYEFFLQTGMCEQEVVHATDRCVDVVNYTVSVRHNPEYSWSPKMYNDAMNSFLDGSYLDWHYRSRDESLINFSNHYLYQGRLVTFPGPGEPPAINHVLVKQEFGLDGQEDSCSQEVQKVVALVLEHARSNPDQTLGVITMGIRHMNRVQAALDQALESHAELGAFFDPNKGERFFVKNLERVQGDERDAIIISIGYGKDRAGNLPLRFGPLLPEGGRRRLNVAVTRARQRLTVVSSISHLDLDLTRVRPGSGVELLRNYLQYAASNGKRLGDAEVTGEPLNAFEAEVFDCLSAKGLRLLPQMGASRFRIDMVAEHPAKPGRYVLAIECDGATYHSSYTARDRDRLRQQQLEALGWRFHRIWSTDWFMRKEDEIQRALKAFSESVEFADKLDRGAVQNHHGNGLNHATPSAAPKRGPKPPVPVRTSISEYRGGELIQLIRWIASDGQLRTDDQIIDEIVPVLGFSRRGVRIENAIRNAIAQWRPQS